LSEPIIGAVENDPTSIYNSTGVFTEVPTPVPHSTALVDAAIDLFSQIISDQPLKIQDSAFSQITACLGNSLLSRNVGRKRAITYNILIALSKALSNLAQRGNKHMLQSNRVTSSIFDILHVRPLTYSH
jgi:hypothetical protein